MVIAAFWLGMSVKRRKLRAGDTEAAKSLDHSKLEDEKLSRELHGESIPAELNPHDGASTPRELEAPHRVAPELDGQQLHELPQSLPFKHPKKTEKPIDPDPRKL